MDARPFSPTDEREDSTSLPILRPSLRSVFWLAAPQPSSPRPQNRLRPVRHLQLAEDVGDVVAHRFEGQPQLIRNLLVAAAPRDERQQFPLPLAQFWKDPGWDGRPGCREEAEH